MLQKEGPKRVPFRRINLWCFQNPGQLSKKLPKLSSHSEMLVPTGENYVFFRTDFVFLRAARLWNLKGNSCPLPKIQVGLHEQQPLYSWICFGKQNNFRIPDLRASSNWWVICSVRTLLRISKSFRWTDWWSIADENIARLQLERVLVDLPSVKLHKGFFEPGQAPWMLNLLEGINRWWKIDLKRGFEKWFVPAVQIVRFSRKKNQRFAL